MEEKDFLQSLGYIGFATRLKRISDSFLHDGRKLYKELGLDIEPNWYIIFKILKLEKKLSVTEIAERVQMSHPSVITLTDNMIAAGYVKTRRGRVDGRVRMLELTRKAKIRLPELEKMWDAGEVALETAFRDINGLEVIGEIERRMNHKGFKDRAMHELQKRVNRSTKHKKA
ncbi:MAG: MarR family transcriptional regulator [Flavobacteriales bacterium]|nr:MarR family transcriptional regulator [Flavobacteriales bacterium]